MGRRDPLAAPPEPLRGGGRFEVRRLLGEGGMGVVYEAFDRTLGAPVALKTLQVLNADELYRFKQEFRLIQDLQHENLVSLGELVEDGNDWFFTMELLEGEDFFRHVRPSGSHHDEVRLRSALAQLLRGLSYLHAHQLAHRDVKPGNVLVTSRGRTVLLDFGLATPVAASQQSATGRVVGTAIYMAPEQADSRKVTSKADMYAVGVLLYEALTGKPPFEGDWLHVLVQKQAAVTERPAQLVAGVPEDLDALCMELLNTDPVARPDAATALSRLGLGAGEPPSPSLAPTADSPQLLGRASELTALRAAHTRARSLGAQVVLVRGRSGIGKTALVDTFCDELRRAGGLALVLSGRCYEREITAYRGFDAVIDQLARHLRARRDWPAQRLPPDDLAMLTRLFPVLGRVPALAHRSLGTARGDQQHLRTRAFDCLRSMLAELGRREPLVIFIDDMQWLDGDGLRLLEDLIAGSDVPRVLWLFTSRPSEGAEEAGGSLAVLRAAAASRLTELDLAPLDAQTSGALAELLLERASAESIVSATDLAREAHGHPLHIMELVRYVAERGANIATSPRLDDAIWKRIQKLPSETPGIMHTLCMAASPLSVDVIARAAGLSAPKASRVLATLRGAQLVRWTPQGRVEPYHDRVREAVAARLSAEQQKLVHASLARALEGDTDNLEPLFYHLRALGDSSRVAMLAAQAAQRAVDAFAFERAANLYRVALQANQHAESDERTLRLSLAHALVNMGHCNAAAAEFAKAAHGADPDTRLVTMCMAAEQWIVGGDIQAGLVVAKGLLKELGLSLPGSPRAALMSLLWHRLRLGLRGVAWRPREQTQQTRQRLIVLRAIGQGLAMTDNVLAADFNARFLLLALDSGDADRVVEALGSEATLLGSQGDTAKARALVRMARDILVDDERPHARAWTDAVSASIDYFEGKFERAEALFRQAIERYRSEIWGRKVELNSIVQFRIFTLRHLGALGTLQNELERELREAERSGDKRMLLALRVYCNILWLARGDVQGAAQQLLVSQALSDEHYTLVHFNVLVARSELDLYQDQLAQPVEAVLERFAPLDRSQLLRVRLVRALTLWLRGRLLLACAGGNDLARRLRQVEKVARQLRGLDAPSAAVWSGLLLGAVASARGQRETAVEALRGAEAAAEACNMRLHAAAARYRLGERLPGPEGDELRTLALQQLLAAPVTDPEAFMRVLAPCASLPASR